MCSCWTTNSLHYSFRAQYERKSGQLQPAPTLRSIALFLCIWWTGIYLHTSRVHPPPPPAVYTIRIRWNYGRVALLCSASARAASWPIYTYIYIYIYICIYTCIHINICLSCLQYERKSGQLQPTDLGRVAAYYYVSAATVAVYNEHLKPTLSDIELLRLFSLSKDFSSLTVRSIYIYICRCRCILYTIYILYIYTIDLYLYLYILYIFIYIHTY